MTTAGSVRSSGIDRSRLTRAALALVLVLAMVWPVAGIVPDASGKSDGADFNGDGRSDILWYAPGAEEDHVWLGQASGFSSRTESIHGTYEPVAGDFDGDGRSDVFWYAPGAEQDYTWYGTGSGFRSQAKSIFGSYEPVVGDFDGDGRSDIFWYAAGAEEDHVWYGRSSGFSSRSLSIHGTYEPLVGDFDGDGRSDIFWYAAGAGQDYTWYGTGSGFRSQAKSIFGSYDPAVGDFDGDGRSDIFWFAAGAEQDHVWYGTGSGFRSQAKSIFGSYEPVVGDFDGDGRSDIFWYAAGAADDHVWYGRSSGFSSRAISIFGFYEPVVGDFDGDGRSDVFWYAAGAEQDYTWYGAGSGFRSQATSIYGSYVPVVMDVAPTNPLAPSSPGDTGEAVAELQRRLRDLNFFVPRVSGYYDSITAQAVMAFQKHHGLARDGVAGSQTINRLRTASPAGPIEGGDHVEVSIAKQTLTVVRGGRVLVFNTSTGAPGWDTPRGRFTVYRQIDGMRHAELGQLWRPKYFNGGIAMHGSPHIPGYPASHGCTRLHNEAINYIWDAGLVPIGTPVLVY